MRIKYKLKAYAELVRVHNLLASGLTTVVGYLAVLSWAKGLHTLRISNGLNPLIPVATVTLVAAGGYAINDYFDVDVDAVNKPSRPIPSGRVSINEALGISITTIAVGVLIATIPGPISFTFAMLNSLLIVAYSYKVKELGLLGNIVVSFEGSSSIIYGGLALSESLGRLRYVAAVTLPSVYAFILLLAREVVKTIEDFRADSIRNVKSLPRVAGVDTAYNFSLALLILILLISPIPYLLGYGVLYIALSAVTDAIILYSIMLVIRSQHRDEVLAGRIRAYLKVAIFTGISAFLTDLGIQVLTA